MFQTSTVKYVRSFFPPLFPFFPPRSIWNVTEVSSPGLFLSFCLFVRHLYQFRSFASRMALQYVSSNVSLGRLKLSAFS